MSLLYAARMARPDLIQTIVSISRHSADWTKFADSRLEYLMGYVKGSVELEQKSFVAVGAAKNMYLETFVDADLGGDESSSRSTSGGLCRLVDDSTSSSMIVDFWSKRQTATAKSTTGAELVSLGHGIDNHAVPLVELLEAIVNRSVRSVFQEDNMAALLIAKRGYSPAMRMLARHFRCCVASLGEFFSHKENELVYCPTAEQRADPLTKGLTALAMEAALRLMGMVMPSSTTST